MPVKVGKAYEGVDWESVREKYQKLRAKFVSNLPPAEDEIFPHPESVFTRYCIASKIKWGR